ncbi:MAG: ABC transporter ATP-binding protein [Bacteroidales bacterium]|jgi:putative ABC transport system ATP-binding protein|nr:ABC transporter ATP-binding protein [Bacteroidales bacterium]
MQILKVDNLTKTYGSEERKVVALDHVSFSVEKGEFLAIMGQSGSGKSTLFHLIAGLDKPDCGKIYLNEMDIFSLKGDKLAEFRRREVGLIYQFYNLIPVLTVEENITLPIRLDKKKVDKERLKKLIDLLGLSDRKLHLPNQLSGGQQQRTAIGRALFYEPSIILADEPTGNLDTSNSNDIIEHLEMLNERYSQTILIITHDKKIAQRANRIITLSDGKIEEDVKVR